MKIAVYAITKNREATAGRWLESTEDADARFVLDCGSEDQTFARLVSAGVQAERSTFSVWDAAQARNKILARVPDDFDVCISLNLDEFLTPNWREEIERVWSPGTTRLAYLRVTDHSEESDRPNRMLLQDRIHARKGYLWKYAADEVLVADPSVQEKVVHAERLQIRHLEIEDHHRLAQESSDHIAHLQDCLHRFPEEPRYHFLLGRALRTHGDPEKSRAILETYLGSEGSYLSSTTRAAAFRELAECYSIQQENPDFIVQTLYRSALENPGDRDSWGHLAFTLAKYENWPACHAALQNAFQSTRPPIDQSIEPAFIDGGLEALLRLSSQQLGIQ